MALPPQRVLDLESQYLAAVSNIGHLLVFPVADLPQMARGKGNKIIGVPSDKVKTRAEYCVAVAVLREGASLVVNAGKRQLILSSSDLQNFHGERGRRGGLLPKAYRLVTAIAEAV